MMNSLRMTPGILTISVSLRSNTYPGQVEEGPGLIHMRFMKDVP